MMVQMDGSHHDWFEGRGPRLVLMGYIDDATGSFFGRFYDHEGFTRPLIASDVTSSSTGFLWPYIWINIALIRPLDRPRVAWSGRSGRSRTGWSRR
jgi:hypothetical protein